MICPECYNAQDYNLCISCMTCSICCDCEGITMTPLDFIASLPHGEAKAAALKVYNLMQPKWIEITDDPATLPEAGKLLAVRSLTGNVRLAYGFPPDGLHPGWEWYEAQVVTRSHKYTMPTETQDALNQPPTHWRPIG